MYRDSMSLILPSQPNIPTCCSRYVMSNTMFSQFLMDEIERAIGATASTILANASSFICHEYSVCSLYVANLLPIESISRGMLRAKRIEEPFGLDCLPHLPESNTDYNGKQRNKEVCDKLCCIIVRPIQGKKKPEDLLADEDMRKVDEECATNQPRWNTRESRGLPKTGKRNGRTDGSNDIQDMKKVQGEGFGSCKGATKKEQHQHGEKCKRISHPTTTPKPPDNVSPVDAEENPNGKPKGTGNGKAGEGNPDVE